MPNDPISLVRQYEGWYPHAWQLYDKARASRGGALPDWPEWCYCPLATAATIIHDEAEKAGVPMEQASADIGNLGALAAWRMTRMAYRFSSSLLHDLWQADISEIPADILLHHMPAWCIYIGTTGDEWNLPGGAIGYFAYLESDANDGHAELRLTLRLADGLVPQAINLTRLKLVDCLLDTVAEGTQNIPTGTLLPIPTASELSPIAALYSRLIAPLLYLCSDGPDILPITTRAPHPHHPYHSTAFFRVGFTPVPASGHASPHPHIRRAHWHLYRVGPGRTGERIRWIGPIPVKF